MRLKKSLINKSIFSFNIKRYGIIGCAFFGILMMNASQFVSCMNGKCDSNSYDYMGDVLYVMSKADHFREHIATLDLFVIASFLIAAVMLWHFDYLNRKRQTLMIHSMPIRRETLYVTNLLSAHTMLLLPILAMIAFLAFINMRYNGGLGVEIAILGLKLVLLELVITSMAAFLIMVSGNRGLTLLMGIVANGMFLIPASMLVSMQSVYLPVYVQNMGLEETPVPLIDIYGHLVPVLKLYLSDFKVMSELIGAVIIYILMSVVLYAAGWICYKKRPMEHVGQNLVFGWAKNVFIFVFVWHIAFFTMAYVPYLFYDFCGVRDGSQIQLMASLAVTFVFSIIALIIVYACLNGKIRTIGVKEIGIVLVIFAMVAGTIFVPRFCREYKLQNDTAPVVRSDIEMSFNYDHQYETGMLLDTGHGEEVREIMQELQKKICKYGYQNNEEFSTYIRISYENANEESYILTGAISKTFYAKEIAALTEILKDAQ